MSLYFKDTDGNFHRIYSRDDSEVALYQKDTDGNWQGIRNLFTEVEDRDVPVDLLASTIAWELDTDSYIPHLIDIGFSGTGTVDGGPDTNIGFRICAPTSYQPSDTDASTTLSVDSAFFGDGVTANFRENLQLQWSLYQRPDDATHRFGLVMVDDKDYDSERNRYYYEEYFRYNNYVKSDGTPLLQRTTFTHYDHFDSNFTADTTTFPSSMMISVPTPRTGETAAFSIADTDFLSYSRTGSTYTYTMREYDARNSYNGNISFAYDSDSFGTERLHTFGVNADTNLTRILDNRTSQYQYLSMEFNSTSTDSDAVADADTEIQLSHYPIRKDTEDNLIELDLLTNTDSSINYSTNWIGANNPSITESTNLTGTGQFAYWLQHPADMTPITDSDQTFNRNDIVRIGIVGLSNGLFNDNVVMATNDNVSLGDSADNWHLIFGGTDNADRMSGFWQPYPSVSSDIDVTVTRFDSGFSPSPSSGGLSSFDFDAGIDSEFIALDSNQPGFPNLSISQLFGSSTEKRSYVTLTYSYQMFNVIEPGNVIDFDGPFNPFDHSGISSQNFNNRNARLASVRWIPANITKARAAYTYPTGNVRVRLENKWILAGDNVGSYTNAPRSSRTNGDSVNRFDPPRAGFAPFSSYPVKILQADGSTVSYDRDEWITFSNAYDNRVRVNYLGSQNPLPSSGFIGNFYNDSDYRYNIDKMPNHASDLGSTAGTPLRTRGELRLPVYTNGNPVDYEGATWSFDTNADTDLYHEGFTDTEITANEAITEPLAFLVTEYDQSENIPFSAPVNANGLIPGIASTPTGNITVTSSLDSDSDSRIWYITPPSGSNTSVNFYGPGSTGNVSNSVSLSSANYTYDAVNNTIRPNSNALYYQASSSASSDLITGNRYYGDIPLAVRQNFRFFQATLGGTFTTVNESNIRRIGIDSEGTKASASYILDSDGSLYPSLVTQATQYTPQYLPRFTIDDSTNVYNLYQWPMLDSQIPNANADDFLAGLTEWRIQGHIFVGNDRVSYSFDVLDIIDSEWFDWIIPVGSRDRYANVRLNSSYSSAANLTWSLAQVSYGDTENLTSVVELLDSDMTTVVTTFTATPTKTSFAFGSYGSAVTSYGFTIPASTTIPNNGALRLRFSPWRFGEQAYDNNLNNYFGYRALARVTTSGSSNTQAIALSGSNRNIRNTDSTGYANNSSLWHSIMLKGGIPVNRVTSDIRPYNTSYVELVPNPLSGIDSDQDLRIAYNAGSDSEFPPGVVVSGEIAGNAENTRRIFYEPDASRLPLVTISGTQQRYTTKAWSRYNLLAAINDQSTFTNRTFNNLWLRFGHSISDSEATYPRNPVRVNLTGISGTLTDTPNSLSETLQWTVTSDWISSFSSLLDTDSVSMNTRDRFAASQPILAIVTGYNTSSSTDGTYNATYNTVKHEVIITVNGSTLTVEPTGRYEFYPPARASSFFRDGDALAVINSSYIDSHNDTISYTVQRGSFEDTDWVVDSEITQTFTFTFSGTQLTGALASYKQYLPFSNSIYDRNIGFDASGAISSGFFSSIDSSIAASFLASYVGIWDTGTPFSSSTGDLWFDRDTVRVGLAGNTYNFNQTLANFDDNNWGFELVAADYGALAVMNQMLIAIANLSNGNTITYTTPELDENLAGTDDDEYLSTVFFGTDTEFYPTFNTSNMLGSFAVFFPQQPDEVRSFSYDGKIEYDSDSEKVCVVVDTGLNQYLNEEFEDTIGLTFETTDSDEVTWERINSYLGTDYIIVEAGLPITDDDPAVGNQATAIVSSTAIKLPAPHSFDSEFMSLVSNLLNAEDAVAYVVAHADSDDSDSDVVRMVANTRQVEETPGTNANDHGSIRLTLELIRRTGWDSDSDTEINVRLQYDPNDYPRYSLSYDSDGTQRTTEGRFAVGNATGLAAQMDSLPHVNHILYPTESRSLVSPVLDAQITILNGADPNVEYVVSTLDTDNVRHSVTDQSTSANRVLVTKGQI